MVHPFLSIRPVQTLNEGAMYAGKAVGPANVARRVAYQKLTREVTGDNVLKTGNILKMHDIDTRLGKAKFKAADGKVYGAVKEGKVWYLTGEIK